MSVSLLLLGWIIVSVLTYLVLYSLFAVNPRDDD